LSQRVSNDVIELIGDACCRRGGSKLASRAWSLRGKQYS